MVKKKNVLQLVPTVEIGGLEKMVLDYSHHIKNHGYMCVVASLTCSGELIPDFKKYDIPVYPLCQKNGFDFNVIKQLKKIIRDNNIEVVHSHNYASLIYAACCKIFSPGLQLIHTTHAIRVSNIKFKHVIVEKVLSFFCSSNIAVGDYVKSIMVKNLKYNPDKVQVIYNGIDLAKFDCYKINTVQRLKKDIGIGEKSKIAGIVSRLSQVKNHNILIDAFSTVVQHEPDAVLLLIGGGVLLNKLQDQVANMGLQDKVIFLGPRDDVAELLSIIDVFVLPSDSEGLSLALLEAAASNCPIIATDVGGNGEIVKDSYNGYIIPKRDQNAISDSFLLLFKDDDKRKTMGENSRQLVKDKFSIETMVQGYINLIQ